MLRIVSVFLLALSAFAQTSLTVPQVSNTGAALCYTAADSVTPYVIRVWKNGDTSATVINDVNGNLFTDAENDLDRPDTVTNGNDRCVQIGHAGQFYQAADTSWRDRVTQANTLYHWDANGVAGPDFTTSNISTSIVGTQALAAVAPYQFAEPAVNPNYQTEWRDPFTGLLIGVIPDWLNSWGSYTGATGIKFLLAESGTWTASSGSLPDSVLFDDNIYAQTGTATQPLFIGLGSGGDLNLYITAATAANPMVITTAWASPTFHVGDTLTITNDSLPGGCTGMAGSKTITAVSGATVTLSYNNTGCTYSANSSFIKMTRIPTSTSFSDKLSLMNVLITGDCNGSGCGSGIDMDICLTYNGNSSSPACASPWKTFQLTTTETEVRICHPEQATPACAVSLDPGDIWSGAALSPTTYEQGSGKVWNGTTGSCSNTPTLCFTSSADCSSLRVNDRLRWWAGSNSYTGIVAATSCGSTPPQITMNDAWPADNNGATGLPFYFYRGYSTGQGFGFLVRKQDVVANATARIDTAMWVAASSVLTADLGFGSGGFNQRCQLDTLLTTNGYQLCNSSNGFWAIKTVSGVVTKKFLGSGYIAGLPGSDTAYYFAETATWSQTESGVFYMVATASSGNSPYTGDRKKYLLKVTLNEPEKECGSVGTTCTLPSIGTDQMAQIDKTVVNLTPCLNSCSTTADDYTLDGQILRLDSSYLYARWGGMGIRGVNGNYIILGARECGAQDCFGYYMAFDLGNGGIPGSTYTGSHGSPTDQQLYGLNRTFANLGFRWSGDHTPQSPLGLDSYFVIEAGNKPIYNVTMDNSLAACTRGTDCGACPTVDVNGYSYTGQLWCSAITFSSSCSVNCGSWQDGDPVRDPSCSDCNSNYNWLQDIQPGDFISIGTLGADTLETVKAVQRRNGNNKDWYVERGCGADQGNYHPRAHSAGATWHMTGVATDPICATNGEPIFPLGANWDFINDATGTDMCWTYSVNHAFTTPGFRMSGGYSYQVADFTSFANGCGNSPTGAPGQVGTFAGLFGANSTPNCVEQHPSYMNYGASGEEDWWADANPIACFGGDATVTNVTGALYTSAPTLTLYPKQFPLGPFQGLLPLKQMNVVNGTSSYIGGWCYAVVNNDSNCYSSASVAGNIYLNGPIDTTQKQLQLEFWTGQMDLSVGNLIGKAGSSAAQDRVPTSTGTSYTVNQFRSLAKDLYYRTSATANIKPFPDGKSFAFRSTVYGYGISNFGLFPPFPADDSVDRNTFIPRTLVIDAGDVPASTSKARVKFGYDEDFRCNDNTSYACYAVLATVNESNPFLWTPELISSSGVSCASGCSIEVPFIEGRILRTQVEFVDGSGNPTGASEVSFDLGSGPALSPTITTTCPLTNGTVNVAYNATMTATGDTPITWTLDSGAWPTGISMNTSGVVSGTPTLAETANFVLKATNAAGFDTLTCSPGLTINAASARTSQGLRGGAHVSGGAVIR